MYICVCVCVCITLYLRIYTCTYTYVHACIYNRRASNCIVLTMFYMYFFLASYAAILTIIYSLSA